MLEYQSEYCMLQSVNEQQIVHSVVCILQVFPLPLYCTKALKQQRDVTLWRVEPYMLNSGIKINFLGVDLTLLGYIYQVTVKPLQFSVSI